MKICYKHAHLAQLRNKVEIACIQQVSQLIINGNHIYLVNRKDFMKTPRWQMYNNFMRALVLNVYSSAIYSNLIYF